jgi:hypothetical protein
MCLYGEHSQFGKKIDFCPAVMSERRGHPNLGGSALLRLQGDTLLNLGMNSMSHVRSQTDWESATDLCFSSKSAQGCLVKN